ncbi:MAG TPA: prepilin peptidase [Rhizomicrobium sp.]|nr:prepilin peptidase [Rhizomicrobium sp.]
MIVAKVLFAALMLVCMVTDLTSYRIRNSVVVALVVLFFILAVRDYKQVNWVMQLGAGAFCLVVGYLMFLQGNIGAGDVKLFSAAALWAGFPALLPLLLYVSLSGLVVMLLLLAARRLLAHREGLWQRVSGRGEIPKVLLPGAGIPYGVGIAAGALIAMPLFPAWHWL